MITFCIALVLLVLGYLLYGRLMERMVGADPKRPTPAVSMADGVDYVPMKPWRIFLIQFLNIAGVGPIVGAIMGAQFGTASFLWIVFGSIFAGAVHDFLSGFMSLRHDGCSLPELHGRYLGNGIKQFMRYFTVILMILVGAMFVKIPATLLFENYSKPWVISIGDWQITWQIWIWPVIIFTYYLLATMLPIDKLIGRIYPVFGILLLLMAVFVMCAFFFRPEVHLTEVWEGFSNQYPEQERSANPIFPMMFVSIACGAISGFHATQSPLMARCMVNEKQARPIFYGAMIAEGVVALIWAAAATYFFHDKADLCAGRSGDAMVGVIANAWFTPVLAVVTVLGVIAAAVTSGDTALRSARLIVADIFHIDQKPIYKRFLVALPVFLLAGAILVYTFVDADGFQTIWRYFAWANQLLATVTLYAITVYLFRKGKIWWLTLLPALFMTMVCGTYIFIAPVGFHLQPAVAYSLSGLLTLAVAVLCLCHFKKYKKKHPLCTEE
ncbi:MAG: carbon starvation protein A [Bacteroidales bacterium]|nr:carbon starvation protein A [Bacteroidales bacterium]